jgi:hypothetical protein
MFSLLERFHHHFRISASREYETEQGRDVSSADTGSSEAPPYYLPKGQLSILFISTSLQIKLAENPPSLMYHKGGYEPLEPI